MPSTAGASESRFPSRISKPHNLSSPTLLSRAFVPHWERRESEGGLFPFPKELATARERGQGERLFRNRRSEIDGIAIGNKNIVLDANTEGFIREIEARLDGDDHAGLQDAIGEGIVDV